MIPAVYTDEWNGYVVTYTGAVLKPLDPDVDAIHIEDIAHALSNLCRFTGHTASFYSVAQHSVIASKIVPNRPHDARRIALTALLHDASEAYLSDFSRPVKQQAGFGDAYRAAEHRLMVAIAMRFGLTWPLPPEIHDADVLLLRTEQRDLMPPLLRVPGRKTLAAPIRPWAPRLAERKFLNRYHELTGDSACTST